MDLLLDKDLGEIAVVRKIQHNGIIRLVRFPARDQGVVIDFIVNKYENDLNQGALITAEPGRIRIRSAN